MTPGHELGTIRSVDMTESIRILASEVAELRCAVDELRSSTNFAIGEVARETEACGEAVRILDARLSTVESVVDTVISGRQLAAAR